MVGLHILFDEALPNAIEREDPTVSLRVDLERNRLL
jgi:hypothetical protein